MNHRVQVPQSVITPAQPKGVPRLAHAAGERGVQIIRRCKSARAERGAARCHKVIIRFNPGAGQREHQNPHTGTDEESTKHSASGHGNSPYSRGR